VTVNGYQNPKVWYPVNRTTGFWLIITGVITGGVSIGTFVTGLGLPAAPLINLAPVVVGIVVMIVHGSLVGRKVTSGPDEAKSD